MPQRKMERIQTTVKRDTGKIKQQKGGKKAKISKKDIGTPFDFRHVGHVGWDPKGGFVVDDIDPQWKKLFDTIGVTENHLEDEETSQFIYDFVEKHGGIEKAIKELEGSSVAPLPPPARTAPAGKPSDFIHTSHVGWDPKAKGGFDVENIDPQWKKLFDRIGVTENQLEDEETSQFIYDFIEQHGGIEKAIKDLERSSVAPLPPPASTPPPSSREPLRGSAPPPPGHITPQPARSRRSAPPPPRPGRSAPPPPGHKTPQPARSRRRSAPSPARPGRSAPPPPTTTTPEPHVPLSRPPLTLPSVGASAPPPPPPPSNGGHPPPPAAMGGPPPPASMEGTLVHHHHHVQVVVVERWITGPNPPTYATE